MRVTLRFDVLHSMRAIGYAVLLQLRLLDDENVQDDAVSKLLNSEPGEYRR